MAKPKVYTCLSIDIDPNDLIDNNLLGPRTPKELVEAFEFYFKEKLKFKGKVTRSVLYTAQSPILIRKLGRR